MDSESENWDEKIIFVAFLNSIFDFWSPGNLIFCHLLIKEIAIASYYEAWNAWRHSWEFSRFYREKTFLTFFEGFRMSHCYDNVFYNLKLSWHFYMSNMLGFLYAKTKVQNFILKTKANNPECSSERIFQLDMAGCRTNLSLDWIS